MGQARLPHFPVIAYITIQAKEPTHGFQQHHIPAGISAAGGNPLLYLPKKLRNALLLVFSLLFYGWGEPKYILIMLFSTVFDYCNGLAIGHFRTAGKPKGAKAVLVVSVVGNLSILGFFKYTDFAITNLNGLLGTAIPALGLLLPIGISFYTFQTMSYTIDVYRGVVPPSGTSLTSAPM